MPGHYEWLIILFAAFFFYVIPIILVVLLIVSHIKIHSSLKQLHQKLNALNKPAGT